MFKLDSFVLTLLYNQCKTIGTSIGFGAFEGFVVYFSIVTLAVLKGTSNINIKKVKK